MASQGIDKRQDGVDKKRRHPSISSLLIKLFGLVEGLISLCFLTLLAYYDKPTASHQLSRSEDDVSQQSHRLWSLTRDNEDFKHNFLSLPNGVQLHYLTPPYQPAQQKRLIIFLHGFPDSCHLWTHMLRSSLRKRAALVALDLPGYGGSDGLPGYGPDEVLTTVASAIKALRRRHGVDGVGGDETSGQCVVVGHDWGGIIASRVASATIRLIDHLVLVNSVFPPHFTSQIKKNGKTGLLLRSDSCVRSQLMKSHYVFMFNLPFFSAARFTRAMGYLLNFCYRMAAKEASRNREWHETVSRGPGIAQCQDSNAAVKYGSSVYARALQQPLKIWDERVRVYREGLLLKRWRTGIDDSAWAVSENAGRVDESKIRCRTTVIFGLGDQALDPRLMVDGIEHHISPRSGSKGQIVLLEGVGHWSPLHESCGKVLETILAESGEKIDIIAGAVGKLAKIEVREMR